MSRIVAAYPLTPMQQGMLFHALYAPGSDAYFIQMRARLRGPLDTAAFEAAWQRVIDRHPILRTAFSWQRRDGARQVVWDRVPLAVRWLDWRALDAAAQAHEWQTLIDSDRAAGFDLSRAPLLRVTLARLDDDTHGFVWSLHHILLDGWSLARVLEELLIEYDAGGASGIVAPRPFQDFVAWIGRQSTGPAESFWREQFAGLGPSAAIADAAASPGGRQYADCRVRVSEAVTDALRRVAADSRVTLPAVLLGAWSLLLARETGESDVVPGVTVSGRPDDLTGVESMIGLFINTLPCRVTVDERRPLDAWLREVQARLAGAQRYGHVALTDVQRWTGRDRATPLFDHLFVFENYPWRDTHARTLHVTDVESFEPTDYPLTLVIQPDEGLVVQATFDTARLEAARVERWLARLEHLLVSMSRGHHARPLWTIEWLDDAERRLVLHTRNVTGTTYPPRLAHQWFEAQADLTPDAPALESAEATLSYAELDVRANRVARWLQARGVGPDVPVGIRLPRSVDMVVAVLGVLKAGGACLPLDPAYPEARLDAMLRDASPPVVLTPETFAHAADASDGRSHDRLDVPIAPAHLFYLIYTSGSTGRPKGIGLPHEAMANLIGWHAASLPPAPRLLQFASLSFDASFHELFAAWATGGSVRLITEEERHDPSALLTVVEHAQLTRVILPVVVLQQWAALHGDEPGRFVSLREIITTGEQLTITRPMAELFARAPHLSLHNHYGPAETHVVTSHTLTGPPAQWPAHPPVGLPIGNCDVFVLDRMGQPVPDGVTGELFLGGVQLARGYHAQPALTAERFVPHPWAAAPGGRLYRTGDQARWVAPGVLEFLGRRDHLVKIRGFRVELGEVETALGDHPAVAGCAVTLREDTPGDKRLVAYVVPREGTVDPGALRTHVAARLPEYMVPGHWVVLSNLPLTPNGKIDRRALPAPSRERSGSPTGLPDDPITQVIAEVWADLLGVDRVGRDDDFFLLGGHSLLAVQVMGRVRAVLGRALPLRVLFERPTLAAFSAAVRESADGVVPAPLMRRPDPSHAPLSPAQRRLVVLERLQPGTGLYVVPGSVRLTGPLDRPALARALQALVARHEPLRTRIDGALDDFTQVIEPAATLPLQEHDGAPPSPLQPPVIDPAVAPMARADLYVEGPETHTLILWMHHLVTDGSSNPVWLRDLRALYAAECTGEPALLPPLPVQYGDIAWHEQTAAQAASQREGRDWWRETLAGLEPLALPTDRPRGATVSVAGATVAHDLTTSTVAGVTRLARAAGVTPAMVHLAAWALLLSVESGQRDVGVGLPVSLRDRPEEEGLVGLFLNTVVVRTTLGGRPPVREWLMHVRRQVLDAHAHRHVPFERVVDAAAPPRDRSRHPLFQVMFDFHGWAEPAAEVCGVVCAPAEVAVPLAKFDLTLTIDQAPDVARVHLEYATALFDRVTAERMLAGYVQLLDRLITTNLDSPVTALPEAPPEASTAVEAWGRGPDASFPSSILPALLANLDAPERRPALVDATGEMSGPALGRAVAQLARRLRRAGVGPEVIVAISAERSRTQVIALLAVLAAGGAYLPLDPKQPKARRAELLRQAGARCVIASADTEADASAGLDDCLVIRADVDDDERDEGADPQWHPGPWDAAQLAYVLFTSGSTGLPKACLVEHGALAAYLTWAREAYCANKPMDWPLMTALTFDLTVTSVFLPLLSGGTLRIVPPDVSLDAQLRRAFEDVDAVKLTPSHATALGALPVAASPRVRTVVVGGEALTQAQVATLSAWAPLARIVNEYGPTEATVGCVTAVVTAGDVRPPIGRPAPGVHVRVVDVLGGTAGVGRAGELLVGGPQLARGYLGQPRETADRFVPGTGAHGARDRMYRTGDRVRWRADGQLEFLGRLDDQIKVRGHRLEPAEVEAALLALVPARRAVVRLHSDEAGERLVAWLERDEPIDETQVRRALAERLPAALCPSAFVVLPALPLTRHGKLDVAALPAPSAAGGDGRAPSPGLEQTVAGIWESLLRVTDVRADDNFFERGGDSIVALQVVAALARAGVHVPADALFTHQTVAGLARIAGVTAIPAAPADQPASAGPDLRTPAQAWFFEAPPPNPGHYAQALAVTLRRPVPSGLLDTAVARVVADHPALSRTGASFTEGSAARAVIGVEYLDVSGLSNDEAAAQLAVHSSRMQSGFDLSSGPLFRVAQVTMPEGACLLLAAHHLIVDGVSWRIVLDELTDAITAMRQGRIPEARPEPVSMEAVAHACRHLADTPVVRAELAHWVSTLAQPAGLWPARTAANDVANERVHTQHFEVESALRLQDAARAAGARVEECLLAALTLAVGDQQTGGLRVEVEGHGRRLVPELDLSRTVGWFTAQWPVWLPRPDSGRPADALRLTRHAMARVPGQGVGFGLLRYLSTDADVRASLTMPTAPVLFNFHGRVDAGRGADDWVVSLDEAPGPSRDPAMTRRHELEVTAALDHDGLHVTWTWAGLRFDDAAVERWQSVFGETVRAIAGGHVVEAAVMPAGLSEAGLTVDDLADLEADLDE